MADNVIADPGSGGATFRTKDRTGVETQIVALDISPGGSETLQTAAALADATANPTTVPWAGMLMCFNGTTWDRVRGDTTNGVFANVKASALPTGAATAAKQPALGTAGSASTDVISVQGVASMTALKTDGSGVTQPVSAASLPLPAGASTAAKQPALGTAGSASADVLSVQGVASMTALKVDGSGVTQPVSGTVTASGPLTDTQLRASAVPVSLASAPSTAVTNAGTFAVQIAANSSVNQAQVAGTTTDTNSGNKSAGTQRVVLATDQPQLTNALKVDGSAVTQPVSGTITGNLAAAAGATGLSKFHLVSAATTNATNVKASAGKLHGWYIYNSNAAARKVAFHNTAGTPTAGASVTDSIVIPGSSAANAFTDIGIAFATGIGITTVTDLTDAGTTAVGASDLVINLYYI